MSNTMILKDKSVQVSRIRRSSSFVMKRPHYHSYYEIYYLLSGKCKMFINQDIYYLEPGDMTIIPPLEVHKALYEPSWEAERFGIYFSRDTVTSFLSLCGREAFGHIFSQPKRTIPSEFRPKIEELLAQMQDEEKQATATARYSFAASCTRFWWYWAAARRPGGKDTRWRRQRRPWCVRPDI